MPKSPLFVLALICAAPAPAAERPIPVLVIDGMNNHDWAAGTRAIRDILEGTGRFTVDVCTWPCKPDFSRYRLVVNNFNGGHLETGVRWPRDTEAALVNFVRGGGGLLVFHAANNAFLNWPEYNDMIGLGWRAKTFGRGLAVDNDRVVTIPKGSGSEPGHGPRHDFELFVLDPNHPVARGLPAHWTHPSEQLTHGQHGPAEGLTVLTYAFSEVTHRGEPMDWVRRYGNGRVYTTMLGHTWKNERNPNLDDLPFQALLARGAEWAATGEVTLAPDLGWKSLFNGKDLAAWEPRGRGAWTVMKDGVLLGQHTHEDPGNNAQAWLYTKRNDFRQFDLHAEFWLPPGGNSGISIRDLSRAHYAVGEPEPLHPELTGPVHETPAHIGYEIQILDDDRADFPTGSVYLFQRARTGIYRPGEWNTMEIESRTPGIRVRVNGEVVAESAGDAARSKEGPIGLQLHDRFSFVMFRNIRVRELP